MNRFGYKDVPQVVWRLFFVNLIVNCGNYMTQFMSMYFTNKLVLSANYVGIFVSLAGLVFLPGSLMGGKLCDIWGKKKVYIVFQSLAAIVTVMNIFVFDDLLSPILFILNAFFVAAIIPVYNSIIFGSTHSKNKKDSLSLFYVGMCIGNMFSSLIGAVYFSKYFKVLFCIEVLMKLLSIIFLIFFVHVENVEVYEEKKEMKLEKKEGLLNVLLTNPILLFFSVSCILFSIILSQNSYALPIHLNEVFGASGTTYYGVILGINAFVVIIATSFINNLTRNKDKLKLILLASMLVGCGFGLVYFGNTISLYVISTIIWSVSDIINSPNSSAYISEFAPENMFGRFAAWIKIVTGAGYAIGPVLFGFVIQFFGTKIVWLLLFAIAIINCAILLLINHIEFNKKVNTIQNGEI